MPCPAVRVVTVCCLFGGCGPSDDSLGRTTPPPSFAAFQTELSGLNATWAGAAISDPASLPASGTASYEGVVDLAAQVAGGERLLAGAISLTADFGAATISGSAGAFMDQNNRPYAGQLMLSNGFIDRTAVAGADWSVLADLDGTLNGAGDTFVMDGDLSADFLGPGQGAVAGIVSGTATSGFGTGYLHGTLIADR